MSLSFCRLWQKVSAGRVLFTVTSPDLIARAKEIAELEKRLADYEATGAHAQ